MKQGWEIKKLGEVCTIKGRIGFRGYTREDLVAQGEGAITLSPSNIINDVLTFDKCQYISWFKYEESPEIQIFNGDIIYAKTASIGKVALVNDLPEKATINPQFVVFKDIKCHSSYLYYAVKGENFKHQISLITNGVAIPTVSQNNMANLLIPVPPLAEQEHIVQELDLLSSIIEKQKLQLKELDNLAQSIFYTMFGDPITNEKGWEVKKLGDIGKVVTGNTPSTKDDSNFSSSDYCFVKPSDILKENVSYIDDTEYYISSKAYQNSRKLPKGSVLTTCIGIIGKVGILGKNATCNQQINAIVLNDSCVAQYVAYMLFLMRNLLAEIANAPIVPIINKKEFSSVVVPIPPLTLQQEFAKKIEAIEKQKELVKQSLAETETLFNSRMDYYFN